MPHASDTRLLVLHGLRLKGFGEPEAIAEIVGVDVDDVAKHLDSLLNDELVVRRDGPRLAGWGLTAAGRAEQERLLADELAEAGLRAAVQDAYESFLALNAPLLEICTAWQMRDETTINDHSDAAYDAAAIARLAEHHDRLDPILTALESAFVRYGPYRPRFDASVARLQSGEHDWFTKPMIDSYHTVWFQLHEDLLNTLGIDRATEGSH
jgi:DNA-binding MarR family transcriptional regulator